MLTGYKWWSSPKGTGGTLVGVRTEMASMSRAKLTYQDDNGRIVAITLHSEDKNLLVVGTYWPAGGSPEALNKRRDMDLQISNTLESNPSCTPLIMGDMNATFFESD